MSASSSVQKEVYIELYALAVCNSEYAQVEKEYMNQLVRLGKYQKLCAARFRNISIS